MKPRVVSLTPLSVDRDSRTLRIAASFAARGWDSVVVEGQRSVSLPEDLPVRLASLRPPGQGGSGQMAVGRMLPLFRSDNPVIAFGLAGAFVGRFMLRHRWQVVRKLPAADLYYVHSFEDFGAVQRAARRTRARVIYDAHDFYSGIIPVADMPPYRRRFIQPFLDWLERRCVAAADGFVTVGQGVADLMSERFGRRPVILRNAHDARMDTRPLIGLRERIGVDRSARLLVTVGNRKIGQAVIEAVAALALLPDDVHLVLVGAGYDAALADAAAHGVEGRVHVVPPVSPTEIVPLIREADIGLVLYWPYSANFLNALPNGFFQVVSACLPLIHGGLPEITRVSATLGIGVVTDLRDPLALAAAIRSLLDDPDRLRETRTTAQKAAESLTWEHEEATLFDLVDTIGVGPTAAGT